jgi:glycosyltransferase involved in cell wall biosynthesis
MRVGLIIYGSLETLTGGYIYDKCLKNHLCRQGHRVDMLPLTRRSYARNLLDNFLAGRRTDLLNSSYDLLLQDALNHPSLFWINRKLRRKLNRPIVTIVHQVLSAQPQIGLRNRLYRLIEKAYLSTVDAFIFNSKTTGETVRRLVGGKCPAIIAPPGGDRLGHLNSTEMIKSRARRHGPLKLIFVGNLTPNKGLYPLIETLSRLSAETWNLSVIGSLTMDRNYVGRVRRLIALEHLEDNIHLTGALDGRELADLLAGSHLLVMPYSHETFGMAYLEAMAFGLPVIGSAAGALQNFVAPGRNGFLVEPGDFAAVNEHIENLHRDRTRLMQMSAAALETFQAQPKWQATLESIEKFLRDLIIA